MCWTEPFECKDDLDLKCRCKFDLQFSGGKLSTEGCHTIKEESERKTKMYDQCLEVKYENLVWVEDLRKMATTTPEQSNGKFEERTIFFIRL